MRSHFFAYIARMRFIQRWALMRNTAPENVQEHSHQVAVLAHALAVIRRDVFGGDADPGLAAAAALYGNNAANGAIVITTKKGKAGALSVTVSQNTEFLRPFRMPEFQNRYGTGSLASSASSVDKSWGARLNAATIGGYDPADGRRFPANGRRDDRDRSSLDRHGEKPDLCLGVGGQVEGDGSQ